MCVHLFCKGERDEKGGGARAGGFREDRWRRSGSDGCPKSVFCGVLTLGEYFSYRRTSRVRSILENTKEKIKL